MHVGIVKWFNGQRGYGFIQRDGEPDIFIHYRDIAMDGYKILTEGDKVTFDIRETEDRISAVNVCVV